MNNFTARIERPGQSANEDLASEIQDANAKHLTVVAALLLLVGAGRTLGAEPTAAGLWQSLDEDSQSAERLVSHSATTAASMRELIVRMFMKPGENPNVVCDLCKDDRRDKPWLGLDIIRGMKRDGDEYTDGTILDPRHGDIYSAMMTLTPDGQTLVVRGYLGISLLGQESILDALAGGGLQRDRSSFQSQPAAARKSSGAMKPQSAARSAKPDPRI